MKYVLTVILFVVFTPMLGAAQAPYFTAFGQLTIPTGHFAHASNEYDAFVKSGYGGGIDLNIHINESLIWMTSLTFSANALDGTLQLDEKPLLLLSSFPFYNLPALTGLAFEKVSAAHPLQPMGAGWAELCRVSEHQRRCTG